MNLGVSIVTIGLIALMLATSLTPVLGGGGFTEKTAQCPANQFAFNETASGTILCKSVAEVSSQCANTNFQIAFNESTGGILKCSYLPPIGAYTYTVNTTTISGTKYYFAYTNQGILFKGGPNNVGGATGTSLSSVMNSLISLSNVKIHIKSGLYTNDAQLTGSGSNDLLEGEGSASNISLTASYNANVLTITGNNWLVTMLRFEANTQVKGSSLHTVTSTGTNNTISFSWLNRGDHGQITLLGTGDQALFNTITNSNDDGIIAEVNGALVKGNIIDKTTNHNCISVVNPSAGFQVIDNICKRSGSNGIALEALGTTGASNTNGIIAHNTIISPAVSCIAVYPISGVVYGGNLMTITNNNCYNSAGYGIELNSGKDDSVCFNNINNFVNSGILIAGTGTMNEVCWNHISKGAIGIEVNPPTTQISLKGNTINSTTSIAIKFDNPISSFEIDENKILNPLGSYAMFILGNNYTINSNSVFSYTSNINLIGIYDSSGTHGIICNNLLVGSSTNRAIYLTTATNNNVCGNFIQGWGFGINEANSADFNNIFGNNVQDDVSNPITIVGAHSFAFANEGFNPVAKSTFTACASVCTYTNNDGYDESFTLLSANGITALTCNGQTEEIVANLFPCIIPPQGTMVITWTTTAPTFNKVPLLA